MTYEERAAIRDAALVEALDIIGIYDEESTCQSCADVTAINEKVTALRARPAVKVKPLVWEELSSGSFRAAAPLFGTIRVEKHGRGGTWTVCYSVPGFCDTFSEGEWSSPEAARAAAMDDFTERLLNALE